MGRPRHAATGAERWPVLQGLGVSPGQVSDVDCTGGMAAVARSITVCFDLALKDADGYWQQRHTLHVSRPA